MQKPLAAWSNYLQKDIQLHLFLFLISKNVGSNY